MENIKIAYIGGGSKAWARVFMYDLALTENLSGSIVLYDIDIEAAERNRMIGERINQNKDRVSKWNYSVADTLKDALCGADFVICSILPGTFDEMAIDVHTPEKYGIFQPVGDTVGPGGVLRAMRTVPIYEHFAREIERHCPNAWVINFTNPMTICTKTLYDVFPKIKAFGCCHEVFHAQDLLCAAASEILGVKRPDRHDIYTDACGINHFTWITQASYQGHDLLKLLPEFISKFYNCGYCERPDVDPSDFRNIKDPNRYGNRVKMDMFNRFGVLGAAGDRHLVEFMPNSIYLNDANTLDNWTFHLTTVDHRKRKHALQVAESIAMANGECDIEIKHSAEEACDLLQAILGMKTVVSNVNIPNIGQMPDMPYGPVVETNCVFSSNSVKPVVANRLPPAVNALVARNLFNIEACYNGIKNRDLTEIFASFVNQPLCSTLTLDNAKSLFNEMIEGTSKYLTPYFNFKKV